MEASCDHCNEPSGPIKCVEFSSSCESRTPLFVVCVSVTTSVSPRKCWDGTPIGPEPLPTRGSAVHHSSVTL